MLSLLVVIPYFHLRNAAAGITPSVDFPQAHFDILPFPAP
jgi:hypothetical protein